MMSSWKGPSVSCRFRCPGPGRFQCSVTGLVFVTVKEAELLYRIIQWDESLLQSVRKTPAGHLFDIQTSGSEHVVSQLHLPHCETQEGKICTGSRWDSWNRAWMILCFTGLRSEGLLSVVHISDDGMNSMKPLQITDTHVVVEVCHLSPFGLVWDILRFLTNPDPVKCQIHMFLRPPNPKTQRRNLNVLPLPSNICVKKVKMKTDHWIWIELYWCGGQNSDGP